MPARLTERQIDTAVGWWCKTLMHPSATCKEQPLTYQQADRFANALRSALEDGEVDMRLLIDDAGPCKELKYIFTQAGLRPDEIPLPLPPLYMTFARKSVKVAVCSRVEILLPEQP